MQHRFEIFYADGSVLRGYTDRQWSLMPSDGVQAIVVLHGCGAREKIWEFDYYWMDSNGKVHGSDTKPEQGLIKFGTLLPDEEYRAIRNGVEQNSKIWSS